MAEEVDQGDEHYLNRLALTMTDVEGTWLIPMTMEVTLRVVQKLDMYGTRKKEPPDYEGALMRAVSAIHRQGESDASHISFSSTRPRN